MSIDYVLYEIELYLVVNREVSAQLCGASRTIVLNHLKDIEDAVSDATSGYVCEDDVRNIYNSIEVA